ncbi:hypothetical protein DVH24_034612 [Malus domestica]|uniref:Uncharacterized protein n=1 Tax=Malus domestica TaxID=3750 RepID=A0A498J169_MALDO|nr:hypothetical protein DVH24_034612 [Malus domestica]
MFVGVTKRWKHHFCTMALLLVENHLLQLGAQYFEVVHWIRHALLGNADNDSTIFFPGPGLQWLPCWASNGSTRSLLLVASSVLEQRLLFLSSVVVTFSVSSSFVRHCISKSISFKSQSAWAPSRRQPETTAGNMVRLLPPLDFRMMSAVVAALCEEGRPAMYRVSLLFSLYPVSFGLMPFYRRMVDMAVEVSGMLFSYGVELLSESHHLRGEHGSFGEF